ncbi:hypothetical protein BXZ70DRAFT_364577 [Cristinia sonorae]|uniref:MYND-type domain-containing protein n=1 Tax=Cristinia sonorae TaxID=1940300 RepID=A0A8K0UJ11_9AGAR|nr:hypothetical protein BXZ70DRAFT_364577 [Cristinia sonorae]
MVTRRTLRYPPSSSSAHLFVCGPFLPLFLGVSRDVRRRVFRQGFGLPSRNLDGEGKRKRSTLFRDDRADMPKELCAALSRQVVRRTSISAYYGRHIETRIVPSLVIACRRQMCCSDSEMDEFSTATFTQRALHSLAHLLKAEASRTAATAQYAQCLVDHNLVSILGQWMSRLPEHRTKDVHLNDIPLLLGAVYDGVGCDSSLYPIVKEKVQRVWDDTLNSLIRIRPGENQETKQRKKKAIESWRQFGDYFRVDEQLMVTTLQVPSELSNFAKYWKIPRRCFSSLCTCAAAGQQHPMRVCKGCYRALYCSRKCQRVDWKLGHGSLCKETWTLH